MVEERSQSTIRHVRELEDIICTLKFELNGLKDVVATVENEAQREREEMKKSFQQRVQEVVQWLDVMRGEVDNKVEQVLQLEEKVNNENTF